MSDSIYDFDSCPYADEQNSDNWHNHPEIFNNVSDQIMPVVRGPLARAKNYNESQEKNMTFKNAYSICDTLKA